MYTEKQAFVNGMVGAVGKVIEVAGKGVREAGKGAHKMLYKKNPDGSRSLSPNRVAGAGLGAWGAHSTYKAIKRRNNKSAPEAYSDGLHSRGQQIG